MGSWRTTEIFLCLDGYELELEHLPAVVIFLPRVHEVEDAVVRPYALPQLLVHAHPFWRAQAPLVPLRSFMELAVLREGAVSGAIRLVYRLWLRDASTLGLVVTLVYEGGPVVLEPVSVRRIRADGHEHHRVVAA
jgi:hypothetical protein